MRSIALPLIAAWCSHVEAEPRAHRVAVIEFDGSPSLARAGRAWVLSVLGEHATIAPAKEWRDALARAPGHGPERWQQASSEASVDAVIEGWVQAEGGRKRLTLVVRDAVTGAEVRTFSVAIDEGGVSAGESKRLASQLHDILGQIEDREPADRASTSVVADDELPRVAGSPAVRVEAASPPRFEIGGGAFVATRGITFDHGGTGTSPLPSDLGHTATGIAVRATAYPFPSDRAFAGPGVSLDIRKSLTSTFHELAWELGVHYRLPLAWTTIDVDLDGGTVDDEIVRSDSSAIPNASYSYVGAGAHLELAPTDEIELGMGARYIHVLGIGQMGEADWYGAGVATGIAFDARAAFAINRRLCVEAVTAYRRVALRFDGSGAITRMTGPMNVNDGTLSAAVNLHVRF